MTSEFYFKIYGKGWIKLNWLRISAWAFLILLGSFLYMFEVFHNAKEKRKKLAEFDYGNNIFTYETCV